MPLISIYLLNFGGVACRISFTCSANTPRQWWEGNLHFVAEGKYRFRNLFFANTLFTELPGEMSTYCYRTAVEPCAMNFLELMTE